MVGLSCLHEEHLKLLASVLELLEVDEDLHNLSKVFRAEALHEGGTNYVT